MIKKPKNIKLSLMPGRIYRVVEGILIKRSVVIDGNRYCNLNVFLTGSYFKSDNREYLTVTPVVLEEVVAHELPPEESSKQIARLEELVEILCSPKCNTRSPLENRLPMFFEWWNKWVGLDIYEYLSQSQISYFVGVSRGTVTRNLGRLASLGIFGNRNK